jgi:molecular chaperone DnaK
MPQIEVTFDIDANGILHVGAKDKATGKESKITIKANSGLSEAEIQKMVQDAEAYADEDRKAIELVTSRNQLDGLIHSTQKSMKEYGEQLSADEKAAIESALKEAQDVVKGDDKEIIDAKAEALSTAAHKLSEKMHAAEAGQSGESGASDSKKDDSDVVDAEFTEVKDEKAKDEKK